MFRKLKLQIALWLRVIANKLVRKSIGPREIFTIFEGAFFETYFPAKFCPDGPPPKKSGVSDLSRDRILKGLGKCQLVECYVRDSNKFEFIITSPTEIFKKRKGFGNAENTISNLCKRGAIPEWMCNNDLTVEESVEQTTSTKGEENEVNEKSKETVAEVLEESTEPSIT